MENAKSPVSHHNIKFCISVSNSHTNQYLSGVLQTLVLFFKSNFLSRNRIQKSLESIALGR